MAQRIQFPAAALEKRLMVTSGVQQMDAAAAVSGAGNALGLGSSRMGL